MGMILRTNFVYLDVKKPPSLILCIPPLPETVATRGFDGSFSHRRCHPRVHTKADRLEMRIRMLLATAVLFLGPVLAKVAARPSSNQLFRKDNRGSVINAPLTDHTKNNGKTDLQWYAKISVGTPPQEL